MRRPGRAALLRSNRRRAGCLPVLVDWRPGRCALGFWARDGALGQRPRLDWDHGGVWRERSRSARLAVAQCHGAGAGAGGRGPVDGARPVGRPDRQREGRSGVFGAAVDRADGSDPARAPGGATQGGAVGRAPRRARVARSLLGPERPGVVVLGRRRRSAEPVRRAPGSRRSARASRPRRLRGLRCAGSPSDRPPRRRSPRICDPLGVPARHDHPSDRRPPSQRHGWGLRRSRGLPAHPASAPGPLLRERPGVDGPLLPGRRRGGDYPRRGCGDRSRRPPAAGDAPAEAAGRVGGAAQSPAAPGGAGARGAGHRSCCGPNAAAGRPG